MAFEIKNPPQFTTELTQWDKETLADGEEMAKEIEKLLNNDVYMKRKMEDYRNEVEITLPADGWSGSAPYTQTVDVLGIKEADKVQLMSAVKKDTPAETVKVWDKMAGMIKAGEALDGQAVFYCPSKKPTEDFNVKLVGVSVNE